MHYSSTRGGGQRVSFQDAALAGLAPDGGLYVPEELPPLELDQLQGLSYAEVACRVMQPMVDLSPEVLSHLCQQAYGSSYGGEVAPLVEDPWGYQLQLFHGPTLSFKDVALQFLGRLLEWILQSRSGHCNLLVATSGDTGSAALASVVGCQRLQAVVMFPRGRVSPVQELQMTTMLQPNTHCLEIDGTFDDCQAIMKSLNRRPDVKARFSLGAVNSVNWARLLAQSCYYVWLYLQTGRPLNVVVPTGNFGNFLSAWLAVQRGVPCRRLALATNENDIVHRYFQSGTYQRGKVSETLAPAMDIQVASNLERFLYLSGGRQAEQVRGWMEEFERLGSISTPDLSGSLCLASGSASREQILRAISEYYRATGELLCPHTAVAWHVSRQLPDLGACTVVATAHPGKFPEAIEEALGRRFPPPACLADLADKPARKTSLPASESAVQAWLEGNLVGGR